MEARGQQLLESVAVVWKRSLRHVTLSPEQIRILCGEGLPTTESEAALPS